MITEIVRIHSVVLVVISVVVTGVQDGDNIFCCPDHVCNCKCGIEDLGVKHFGALFAANGRYQCKICKSNKKKCFPGSASIKLENGRSVRMSELQVGDRVQTG